MAGAEVDAGDDAKVGVADVGIGSAKHRMVQPVKRFGAEREVRFLGEVGFLRAAMSMERIPGVRVLRVRAEEPQVSGAGRVKAARLRKPLRRS